MSRPQPAHRHHGVCEGPLWKQFTPGVQLSASSSSLSSTQEERKSYDYCLLIGHTMTSYADMSSYQRGDHPTSQVRIVGASAWNHTGSKTSGVKAEMTFRMVTFQGTHIYCTAPSSTERDTWLAALHAGLEASYSRPLELDKPLLTPPPPKIKKKSKRWGQNKVIHCKSCGRQDEEDATKPYLLPSSIPLPQYGIEGRCDMCVECLISQGTLLHVQMLNDLYASEAHQHAALREAREVALRTVQEAAADEKHEDNSGSSSSTGDLTGTGDHSSWTHLESDNSTTDGGNNMSGSWMTVEGAVGTEQHWINILPTVASTKALIDLVKTDAFGSYRRICPLLDVLCTKIVSGDMAFAVEFFEALDENSGRKYQDDDEAGALKKEALVVAGDMGTAMKLLQNHAVPPTSEIVGDHHTEMLACLLEFFLDLIVDGELSSVAFFWPQLQCIHLSMLPPKNLNELVRVELMEDFLLTVCCKHSVQLAIEIVWGYVADLEESFYNIGCGPACRRRRFAVIRFLCELESLLFDFDVGWGGGSVSLRAILVPSRQQIDLLRASMEELQSHRKARSPSPSLSHSVRMEKLKEFSAKFMQPPEEAAKEALRIARNADYFSSHLSFTRRLGDIADKLRFMEEEKRLEALDQELDLLNTSGGMGGDPMNKALTQNALKRVVRVPRGEGHVFRSKERTPVLLLMEITEEGIEGDILVDKNDSVIYGAGAEQSTRADGLFDSDTGLKIDDANSKENTKTNAANKESEDVHFSLSPACVELQSDTFLDPVKESDTNEVNLENDSEEFDEVEKESRVDNTNAQLKSNTTVSATDGSTEVGTNTDASAKKDSIGNAEMSQGNEKDVDEKDDSSLQSLEVTELNETEFASETQTVLDDSESASPTTSITPPLNVDAEEIRRVSPRHALGGLKRFEKSDTPVTPGKEQVKGIVASMVINQLNLPDLAVDEESPFSDSTAIEPNEGIRRESDSALSLPPGDSGLKDKKRISPNRKMSRFGSITSGVSDCNDRDSSIRRDVLATIMIKGMRGSSVIARGAAPSAQKNLQALDRKRAVDFVLDNARSNSGLLDDDKQNTIIDADSAKREITLSLRIGDPDHIMRNTLEEAILERAQEEGEITGTSSEEDEAIESIRLLLIQARVAEGDLSPEIAARVLAPNQIPPLNQTDTKKTGRKRSLQKHKNVVDSDSPQIDAGDVDPRLAGCGILPPAVLQALTLWKADVVSEAELLELVKKDLQYIRHAGLPGAANATKLIEDSAFWGRFAFGERWAEKKARIGATSPKGSVQNWDLMGVIVKSNDDLRQEAFVMQLIELCQEAFDIAGLELWINPYCILATGRTTGIIEMVRNAMSFDSLKKRPGYGKKGLLGHLERMAEVSASPKLALQSAKLNFVRSLAAYSVMSYFFLFKDRHNGNILLDTAGHVIHIDFGFVFGIAPGGSFSLEMSTPFKFTEEMLEVMGGLKSPLFSEFVTLFCCGFLTLQAHVDTFCTIVEISSKDSSFNCFEGKDSKEIVAQLRERFRPELDKESTVMFAMELIHQAVTSRSTSAYDSFQYWSQGIAP